MKTPLLKSSRADYNDTYPTCEETHVTLRIYLPEGSDPDVVTEKLGLQPTRTQRKGELRNGQIKQWPTAWFINSEEKVQSKDLRRHLDWLMEQLSGKQEVIRELQKAGARLDISCFWASACGHGGPMLDPRILKRLARLNIGLGFDIYFAGDDIGEALERARAKIHPSAPDANMDE